MGKSSVRQEHEQLSLRTFVKGSKNNKPTEVVDTNNDVARALGAAWKLQQVKTNNVKGFCWKRILQNRSRGSGTFYLGAGEAT